jgi:hypothetical protein
MELEVHVKTQKTQRIIELICQPFEARSSSKQYLKIQFLPQRKQRVSITQINWLVLFGEITATYSEKHTFCGQNGELLNVKAGGTHSYHYSLRR